jgi:hypothetical protein
MVLGFRVGTGNMEVIKEIIGGVTFLLKRMDDLLKLGT